MTIGIRISLGGFGGNMAIATRLYNPNRMSNTVGYEGFSWTCLFFGPFPALFRGDLLGFLVMLAAAILTLGLSGLVFMFVYNRWHYTRLLAAGYVPHLHPSALANIQVNVR